MSKVRPGPAAPPPQNLTFSFRYFDASNPKFACRHCDGNYFVDLLERLKALTAMTRDGFIRLQVTGGDSWRVHQIDWSAAGVTESGFGLPVQLTANEAAWQFNVSLNRGRVHGFLGGTVFYVRWLDPNHSLYGNRRE